MARRRHRVRWVRALLHRDGGVRLAVGVDDVVRPVRPGAAARFRYAGALSRPASRRSSRGRCGLPSTRCRISNPAVWIGRGRVFALVGVVTAELIDRISRIANVELELAEQERDFAVRQAAVIATVSHEFRTPLTVITGVARTLEVHGMVSGEGAVASSPA